MLNEKQDEIEMAEIKIDVVLMTSLGAGVGKKWMKKFGSNFS